MAPFASAPATVLNEQSRDFYQAALRELDRYHLPYLVGGAYAFARYTGIERHTKDFDIFIRRADWPHAEEILSSAGYHTELTFPHWVGKAFGNGDDFIDLIFGAGNGVAAVDDLWFEHAVPERVLDMDVKLIPPEEMIWSKGLIMERERYDGADVAHIIHSIGEKLDWSRLLRRYDGNWRALYSHLILFGFIYPSKRSNVPAWVMHELGGRLGHEIHRPDGKDKACYGTILSRQQYLIDVQEWGYKDARLKPSGNLTPEEIAQWTAGIDIDGTK